MNWPLIAFFTVFILIFILRMPIPIGVMTAACVYCLVGGLDLKMVCMQSMSKLMGNYTVIAIPLFIFAANIMNAGKVTDKIFDFALGIVGRLRGGLGHVNVIASLIFAGMTGSAMADAAGLGKMEIAAMRDSGYDDGFSCAVTAGSAVLGPIFPPSITMVIYAMYSGASVGALFMGGMVPAILLALAEMCYIAFIAKKRNYPREPKMELKLFLRNTVKAIPALFTPVILLLGIYTGIMTATEAGAIAGVYALFIAAFVYRSLSFDALRKCIVDTIKTTGSVSIMIGAAGAMSHIVTKEGIAKAVAKSLLNVTDNAGVLMLLIIIAVLFLGCFCDNSIINQIFLPIMMPLVMSLGLDLVHFGVTMVFAMMVGMITPPFGMLLFIVSNISDTPLQKVIKEIVPFIIVMIGVLLVVAYVPDIILILPKTFLDYAV